MSPSAPETALRETGKVAEVMGDYVDVAECVGEIVDVGERLGEIADVAERARAQRRRGRQDC